MKLVVAVFPPERLEAVQDAVNDPGAFVVAVSQASDVRSPARAGTYRGVGFVAPCPRLRLELAVVNETRVLPLVNAIRRAGATAEDGRHGCGDVLVMPLEACERIVQEPARRLDGSVRAVPEREVAPPRAARAGHTR